jgi:hypothetical protein
MGVRKNGTQANVIRFLENCGALSRTSEILSTFFASSLIRWNIIA